MQATVYTKEGKKSRDIALPARLFDAKKRADLVHQVVVSQTSSAREPLAHTKTRGEVRGGGKKPWRQKGTGRARHGSIRSPIWVGGGVSHGPRKDKNYERKINRKAKAAALASILSDKARDKEIILVEDFALAGKTRDGVAIVKALAKGAEASALTEKKKNAAYLLFAVKNPMTERALRNIGNISLGEVRNLDVVSALKYKFLVLVNPEKSFGVLSAKVGEIVTEKVTPAKKKTVKQTKVAKK